MRSGTCSYASRKGGLVQAKWIDQILETSMAVRAHRRPQA
jgi:hypothetical protein